MPIDLALTRILRLLAKLGNPHIRSYRSVHVAGTNGKGSTLAYLSSIMTQSKIRNGKFTSPHILSYNDCISINDQAYPKNKFDEVKEFVMSKNEGMGLGCTEFEILTATAFKIFELENVDLALVEVGLGGRLDATNVLIPPYTSDNRGGVIVTAITKIGMDHEGLLGNSLVSIAAEKAGIIKNKVPVIVDFSNEPSVLHVIEQKAHKENAALVGSNDKDIDVIELLKVSPLKGHYQASNLSIALKVTEVLKKSHGFDSITDESIISGIKRTCWPARLQIVKDALTNIEALLDGAHNESAAIELGRYLDFHFEKTRRDGLIFVIALTEGKSIPSLLKHIIRSKNDTIIPTRFTPPPEMPWVRPYLPDAIVNAAAELSSNTKVVTDEGIKAIFEELQRLRTTGDSRPVVFCGSLYLCSDVLRYIQNF